MFSKVILVARLKLRILIYTCVRKKLRITQFVKVGAWYWRYSDNATQQDILYGTSTFVATLVCTLQTIFAKLVDLTRQVALQTANIYITTSVQRYLVANTYNSVTDVLSTAVRYQYLLLAQIHRICDPLEKQRKLL